MTAKANQRHFEKARAPEEGRKRRKMKKMVDEEITWSLGQLLHRAFGAMIISRIRFSLNPRKYPQREGFTLQTDGLGPMLRECFYKEQINSKICQDHIEEKNRQTTLQDM